MHIGISTSVIQRGKTGVAQYVFALLRALTGHRGFRFTLFVLQEDLPLFSFLQGRMECVPVPETFRPAVKNIWWHQTSLPRLARRHKLDAVHIPSYRRMVWRKPCALVATIHDLAPFRLPGKYDRRRMFYGKVVARNLAWRQDEVIAISKNTARDIETFFKLPQQRVSVIHNGIEHARFFPGDREQALADIRARYHLVRPFFLYVARLEHPGKNHIRLISAFEQFKAASHSEWQLVFGGSDWHGAEVIHDALAKSPFASDIKCLGFVPDTDLPNLYRAAEVFVYPSLYEGFGMPPLEAMACGCPVIASPNGSLEEVLGGAAASVNAEDLHTIARELYRLATSAELRNQLRAAGLAQARNFTWERTAEGTLEVYRRAVSCRS